MIAAVALHWLLASGPRTLALDRNDSAAVSDSRHSTPTTEPAPPDVRAPLVRAPDPSKVAAPAPTLSPFRRSHPWAAELGGFYYYPSRCSEVLAFEEAKFFRTERDAHDAGFQRAPDAGCP